MPPWLRGQPLPPRPETAPAEPQPDEVSAPLPAWLQDSATGTSTAATPDETLPSWLRQTAEQDGEALPDWLREAPPSELTPASSQSDQQRELDNLSSEPAAGDAEVMPDWLRGITADVEDQPTLAATQNQDEVPDWLLEMAGEQNAAPVMPLAAEPVATPDWLHPAPAEPAGDTAPPSSGPTPQDVEEPAPAPGDIASWLQDISPAQVQAAMHAESEPADVAPFSFEEVGEPGRTNLPASGPPAWLGNEQDTNTNWFEAPPPAPAPITQSDSDDRAPGWLLDPQTADQGLRDAAPAWLSEAGSAPPALATEPIPAWLTEADVQPTSQADPDQAAQTLNNVSATDEAPDWMRANATPRMYGTDNPIDVGGTQAWLAPAENEPEATRDTETEQPPPWLGAAEPAAAAPSAPVPDTNTPDWLRETEAPSSATDESLPTWLRSAAVDQPAELASAPPVPAADPDLPPWLRDEQGTPLPTADKPGEQALPPWLKGSGTTQTNAQPATPLPQEPALESPTTGWFDQAITSDTTEQAIETPENKSEFLDGADLPAWLRPKEKKPTASDAEGRALDWLTRLGSPEDEESIPLAATARLVRPTSPGRSAEQMQAIALLTSLAADPGAQTAKTVAPATRTRRFGVEQVLYLLLLATLLIGIGLPALITPLQVPPSVPVAQPLYTSISALGEDDVVLIGYDWDARRVAELQPLEDAVVDQLIEQGVKLVLVSTDPQGSLLLYNLRERLNTAGYAPSGTDYIILGYQPGGEFALRSMAQNFGQLLNADFQGTDVRTSDLARGISTGTNQPLDSLDDFSMIMLLADDQVDVQGWMEQVQRTVPALPFSILLTAEAAPAAAPYLRTNNVLGLSGTDGALAYQALRGDDAGTVAIASGQLRLGLAAFATLLLVSALITAITGQARRRNA
ncbi:MAG: hypothetical protein H7Z42_07050 [Roseiflexaceae bacterium]|nr:hypothetical protein [Roseiflexaceae bacterium]